MASVDHNTGANVKSPPSRGAWIEISNHNAHLLYVSVAPLAGGVD